MHVWTGIDHRSPAPEPGHAGGLLQQAVDRQLRLGFERSMLVLHLSQLLAPAPHPHHRRVARLVLDDAAQLYGGQVFPHANGDLVLLGETAGITGLIETLTRLFRVDAPANGRLLSLWTLPADADAVLAYADQAPAAVAAASSWSEPNAAPNAIDAITALIAHTRFSDLVRRQAAVHITPAGVRPLYREVAFSTAALQAQVAAMAPAQADPFLFRHLASRLDLRMLAALSGELTRGGPLAGCETLHLNLTLSSVGSEPFSRFAAIARDSQVQLGVEISLLEACADPAAFAAARALLRTRGCGVILDGVSHPALLITTPEALEPDLVKLDWTPRMAALVPREQRQLATALQRLDPERIVLQRAETEAALAWGRLHGIRRFQGRHVDAMMAASRMQACQHSAACTFRQCLERAAATGDADRAGCRDMALLDSGVMSATQP